MKEFTDPDPSKNEIAIFSSTGSAIANGENLNKPDVVAPGAYICSTYSQDTKNQPLDILRYDQYIARERCPDGHIGLSGTSMAAPVVRPFSLDFQAQNC